MEPTVRQVRPALKVCKEAWAQPALRERMEPTARPGRRVLRALPAQTVLMVRLARPALKVCKEAWAQPAPLALREPMELMELTEQLAQPGRRVSKALQVRPGRKETRGRQARPALIVSKEAWAQPAPLALREPMELMELTEQLAQPGRRVSKALQVRP